MNKTERIRELEEQAMREYCEDVPWNEIISMLSEDEQEEYNDLISSADEETETPNYIGCRIDGWNIFYFVEDKEGNMSRHVWEISHWLAKRIDEEFAHLERGCNVTCDCGCNEEE